MSSCNGIAVVSLVFLTASAWAGAHDYYECTRPDGSGTHFSVNKCASGEIQRKVSDEAAPPPSQSLGVTVGGTVRLESGRGGHFYSTALINGVPIRVVVDTGATLVAISPSAAQRINLDMRQGIRAKSYTANGLAPTVVVKLPSIELGGNKIYNVVGAVTSQELGPGIDALLGMSFLRHFEVNTDGMVMTLRPK